MVKVYLIKKRSQTKKIREMNNDIKGNLKIICMIYLDGCPACERASPIWSQATNVFKKKHPKCKNRIAYINRNTLDDIDVNTDDIRSFPQFATIEDNQIKKFEPDRTVSGLMQFLEEESKNEKKDNKVNIMIGGKKTRKIKRTNKITKKVKNLHPKTKMLSSDYIKSGIHSVYYSCYGNKKGKPVLVVHGGPGGKTYPETARYFNPKKYYVVMVDQRGCGKSKPFGELKDNNTHELIKDFERIREKLNIKKWMLWGGSWGSTLSLLYALKHPKIVSELILRGIFLGGKDEIDWINNGTGANYFFPEKWENYLKIVPKDERDNIMEAYGKRIEGKYGNKTKDKFMFNWARWEEEILSLVPKTEKQVKKELLKDDYYKSIAKMEYHYFKNNLFIPNNFLKNKEKYKLLKNIPVEIIHGRYDMVCPPYAAYELHQLIPHSKLHFTIAGHTVTDEENKKKLIEITNKYA